jgi:hypothetical protein
MKYPRDIADRERDQRDHRTLLLDRFDRLVELGALRPACIELEARLSRKQLP